jgi:hypothetical protein
MTTKVKPDAPPATRWLKRLKCGFLPLKDTIVLPRGCVAKNGPVPTLMRKGRWELAVWLLLIAAARLEDATVDLEFAANFAKRCLGLGDKPRSTTTSLVARILDRLSDERMPLIKIVEQRHGHCVVQLLALDGSGKSYAMPHRSQTRVIHIPSELLANGWHLVLTPPQIAALLIAFTEEAYQFNKVGQAMWTKSRDHIAADYGMAASTWAEAKKKLHRLGLLEYDNPRLLFADQPVKARQLVDHYRNHRETLALLPKDAQRFADVSLPVTVRAAGTGDPLRLHTHIRVPVPHDAQDPKIISIESIQKGGAKGESHALPTIPTKPHKPTAP